MTDRLLDVHDTILSEAEIPRWFDWWHGFCQVRGSMVLKGLDLVAGTLSQLWLVSQSGLDLSPGLGHGLAR